MRIEKVRSAAVLRWCFVASGAVAPLMRPFLPGACDSASSPPSPAAPRPPDSRLWSSRPCAGASPRSPGERCGKRGTGRDGTGRTEGQRVFVGRGGETKGV